MKITFDHVTSVYNAGSSDEQIALKNICLEFDTSRIIGICGIAGSGKSTFIRHLNGILKPTSGRMLIDGADLHASKDTLSRTRQRIGMTFQFPERQLFGRTVWEELSYTLARRQSSEAEIEARIRTACKLLHFNLEELRHRSPFSLSRGQQRRLGIAVILTLQPELLVLDEPTAGMDRAHAYQLLDVLHTLQQKQQSQIILVSHDIALLLKYAKHLIIFNAGTILLNGTPHQVLSRIEHLETGGLMLPPVYRTLYLLQKQYSQFHTGVTSVDEAVEEVVKNVKRNVQCGG